MNGVAGLLVDVEPTVLWLLDRDREDPGLTLVAQVRQGWGSGIDPVGEKAQQFGIGTGGTHIVLETMYDDLLEVVRRRPGAVVVPSAVGEVQETYRLLTAVVGEKS